MIESKTVTGTDRSKLEFIPFPVPFVENVGEGGLADVTWVKSVVTKTVEEINKEI